MKTTPKSGLAAHEFLADAPTALATHWLDLGFGRTAVIWVNENCRIAYDNLSGHTLSLYLNNGSGTRRVDGRPRVGWPGAFTMMPQGQTSKWEIVERFKFIHLHLPDSQLRQAYAETFERDCRLISLPEMTFVEAPQVGEALVRLADACAGGDLLFADEAMSEAVRAVFDGQSTPCEHTLTGGLATHIQRRMRDYIEANLGEPIRLRELGTVAGLSEFHLQRAFSASYGVSPHGWLSRRRITQAKALLRGGTPIADIAAACGYSSQSHLTRAFKAAIGVTPAAYRAMTN